MPVVCAGQPPLCHSPWAHAGFRGISPAQKVIYGLSSPGRLTLGGKAQAMFVDFDASAGAGAAGLRVEGPVLLLLLLTSPSHLSQPSCHRGLRRASPRCPVLRPPYGDSPVSLGEG